MEENKTETPVQSIGEAESEFDKLDKSGEIELPEFDPTPFIGKSSMIAIIEERKGQYGFYIKLLSLPVDNKDIEIRASRIFGLQADVEGKIGWGPETKFGQFLKKQGVKHYKELIENPEVKTMKDDKGEVYRKIVGTPIKNVIIQTRAGGDGKDYLTF